MGDSIMVLGLDAVDHSLACNWECENLLLENHREIETFSHSIDEPSTLEVWPTIATGVMPDDHGVVLNPEGRDTHPLYAVAVRANQLLPDGLRDRVRELKQESMGESYPTTDSPHVFEKGTVYNWPGVTPCYDWSDESDWFAAVTEGDLTAEAFRKKHLGNAGKGIGWLAGQFDAGVSIAGAHIHMLDHMGHIYATRPDQLKQSYEAVDGLVGWLRERVDKLVIVSDHGMQTTALNDSEPGVHSGRALISTTESGQLPSHVSDVRGYLEDRTVEPAAESTTAEVDAPREHLEDLGYI